MKLPHRFLAGVTRPSKKATIIIIVAIILVTIAGYSLWSRQVWAQYQPSYMQWHQDIQTSVDKAVTLPTTTEKERSAVTARFTDIVRHIKDTQQTTCWVPSGVEWQTNSIDSLADMQTDCQAMVSDMNEFKAQLQKITTYLHNDQALAKILAAIPQPDELADDKWSAQAGAWEKAIQSAKDLSVGDAFQPTKTLAVKQMTTVKNAWKDVIAAHKAKDKKQYLAAQAALATAYDELHKVTTTSKKTVTSLLVALQKIFAATFDDD
ncbi:MAG TPA: hypothetical protein VFM68_01270 [Candidatus Saccharimonadales bacterium]|nr:hypothetical protein [Candidatus Saccharimonadales bacterium]